MSRSTVAGGTFTTGIDVGVGTVLLSKVTCSMTVESFVSTSQQGENTNKYSLELD